MFGAYSIPIPTAAAAAALRALLPLGFHLLALLFSTISEVNRLLSICTRLLIQELVCTDDGTPFTMLIKVAGERPERGRQRGTVGK